MSMFWIAGIIANIVFFGAAMYWIVKQWKQNKASRQQQNSDTKP